MSLLKSVNPAVPDESVVELATVAPESIDPLLDRAAAAGEGWAALAPAGRAAALEAFADRIREEADDLAELVSREVGKPRLEASAEVGRAEAILRFQAQGALAPEGASFAAPPGGPWTFTRRRPRGVCLLITPWNFPLAIPLWKAAPALAWGNSVVVKPASPAIGCAQRLAELAAETLPEGVFGLAVGGGQLAQALIAHPRVDCVSFTGSDAVGSAVIRAGAARGIPVQAEMGGQNPSLVLADADLEAAAATIAGAAMGFAGQKCTATSRVLVEAPAAERFGRMLSAAVDRLAVGDPAEGGTEVGPLISAAARAEALAALAAARRRGGQVLTGGAERGPGFALEPALVQLADGEDPLAQEEVFAPLAGLVEVRDLEHGIEVANSVRYGLSAAVFTADLGAAMSAADRLQAGLVRVNASTAGVDFFAPFGGTKASSHGPREQGPDARDFYTTVHTVSVAAA